MTQEELDALLARPCACGRAHLRVRALATGSIEFLDGEPVSPVRWAGEAWSVGPRTYRVECDECRATIWERDDCPLCHARGSLERALTGRHGLDATWEIPRACPRCDHPELLVDAEVRMHLLVVVGRVARRVADATPGEPGFHVVQVRCPSCEATVAEASSMKCAACGRSSLVKRSR